MTTITQTTPFSNSTTSTNSSSFTDALRATGNTGAVTFTTTSAPPGSAGGIKVSSSGVVTTTGALSAGTYTASGTDSDSSGDTGTWSFSLTVTATVITQVAPTTGTTTTGKAFTSQLKVSGSNGTVTFTQSAGTPHLTISSSGKISAPATLAAGTYKATGTVTDSSGGTGSWSFALTVKATKLTQVTPTTGTTTTNRAFTGQLKVSGSHDTVTYTQSTGATHLTVSSSGAVSAPATLAAGVYKATGTERDSLADTGTWSFALTVTANKVIQVAPTTGTTTTNNAFTSQLKVSGSHGAVTYTQSMGAPHLRVSSSGKISAPATLAAGVYKATGTVTDSSGGTGSWSFSLTVTATKISQAAPASTTTVVGRAYTGQLKVSGSHGTVTYTQSTGTPDLKVSSSGAVFAPASLAKGTYTATGSDSDSLGDTGTWSFTLTVAAIKLTQVAPATATTTTGRAFTGQLKVSGSRGTVTYAQSTGAPYLKVSSSGAISAPATLPAGTYKARGTAIDTDDDSGTWSFTLRVAAIKLAQLAPVTETTTARKTFAAQLKVSGSHGTVTFTQSAGAPYLKVSSSGAVSAPATLPVGTYRAAGSVRDTLGDRGTWSFTLIVAAIKLAQLAPATGTTTTGRAFTGQLKVSGSRGTVTYAQSTGAPYLKVSSSGAISAPATLPAGTYKATGTVTDSSGGTGSWSFALTVAARILVQLAPITGTTASGRVFTAQLNVSGSHGTVTYTQSAGAPYLKVSSSGAVSVPVTLPVGTYRAAGSVRDTVGDSGTWSFTLTVTANSLRQTGPTTATTTTGRVFTGRLSVSGSHGTVTYSQSVGAPYLKVSSSGAVSAPDTLPAGTYQASGTAKDATGDTGIWLFKLTVKATKLVQVAPTSDTTAPGATFTAQLYVSGSHGAVTYTASKGLQVLTVSSSGVVSAPATLPLGTYVITGTVRDSLGDSGTWTFTLIVSNS